LKIEIERKNRNYKRKKKQPTGPPLHILAQTSTRVAQPSSPRSGANILALHGSHNGRSFGARVILAVGAHSPAPLGWAVTAGWAHLAGCHHHRSWQSSQPPSPILPELWGLPQVGARFIHGDITPPQTFVLLTPPSESHPGTSKVTVSSLGSEGIGPPDSHHVFGVARSSNSG
jgi:hypothetical protein